MKLRFKLFIAALSITLIVVGLIVGLRVWASKMPIQLSPVWNSIEKCADNQKKLYQSLEYFVYENDRLPDNLDEFRINDFLATMVWRCPATQRGYDVFLENYGNPRAVVIADKENKHPTTFMLWFRGYKPHVQTMGDGTIHLFEGGKILTMNASSSRPFKPKPVPSMAGKSLPDLEELGIEMPSKYIDGKILVICFFDVNQRPSRHCITQLAAQAESLSDRGVIFVAVQASKIAQETLSEWVKKHEIPFSVGMIKGDQEKTRFTWGVQSLPWLILADKSLTVVSQGFSPGDLDNQLKQLEK